MFLEPVLIPNIMNEHNVRLSDQRICDPLECCAERLLIMADELGLPGHHRVFLRKFDALRVGPFVAILLPGVPTGVLPIEESVMQVGFSGN